jgi:5,10-methylene-tetrahydrofolate dehydrogenase/methenyl tetrahydrofolate cyclohydrolase
MVNFFSEKKFLVIGQGQLVGLPVAHLLQQRRLNVKTATSLTENLNEILQQADVVVSAAGRPGLVVGQNLKPGAVIIDAGTAEATAGGIVGDVDFSSASKVAGFISPVPGGVGPVTVACLLENVLQVAKTKI